MLEGLFGKTKVLEKALDATYLKNSAIVQNLANDDTPDYKRKTVNFEDALQKAMEEDSASEPKSRPPQFIPISNSYGKLDESTASSAIDSFVPSIETENPNLSMRLDGNNVDIDQEMAELAKNQIKNDAIIQSLNGQFSKLRYAISEGKR